MEIVRLASKAMPKIVKEQDALQNRYMDKAIRIGLDISKEIRKKNPNMDKRQMMRECTSAALKSPALKGLELKGAIARANIVNKYKQKHISVEDLYKNNPQMRLTSKEKANVAKQVSEISNHSFLV